ncbi:Uncharacterized membrane protein YhaH, DUF805 family [Stutzerimonas kunmingensis]|uniref:DUF805 domain-containing protein n=1 Tax=Stutzerimonas kunmingensis TaxID=1211807 RepID=UPI0008E67F05|nr:DUF805 domain-containing protein [Stutzerimonas kunmingensis]MCQ2044924.1 DUF805 domain-containing protein [Stutzerimonas kunmingensis]SFK05228.1 Uncharacterized membrane protein YhaH, DUF805 family [Stutzerimonas kunmingensis]
MQQAQFKIVFTGELMPDMPLEAVKANLAVLFKTDPSKVERLFSGQAAVIKSKLSSQEADKYIGALHRAGARAYKEPEHTSPTLSLVQTDEELAAAQGDNPPAALMTCPKCGHTQSHANECSTCGIIIEKYLARQAQLHESVAPQGASATVSPYAPPSANVSEAMPRHGDLKPFSVTGRIGRLRYLAWSLVIMFAATGLFGVAAIMTAISSTMGLICMGLIGIGMLVVSVQIGVQRLHDFGWSGWLILLNLVPVLGSLFPFVMLLMPGSREVNRYGSPPPPNSRSVKILAALWLLLIISGLVAALTIPALVKMRQGAGF